MERNRNIDSSRYARFGAAWCSVVLAVVLAVFITTQPTIVSSASPDIDPFYGADGYTLLFQDFENSHSADTAAAQISYKGGYLKGSSVYLPDTASSLQYSENFWPVPGENNVAGTIEMYYCPETFLFGSGAHTYANLFTMDERPATPTGGGYASLCVMEKGNFSWTVSKSNNDYVEAAYPTEAESPVLNPGQWYHIAGTWQSGTINLYINGKLAASENFETNVLSEPFMLGGTSASPFKGTGARGRIDRFRVSSVARSQSSFPSCLDVRILSPTSAPGGVTLARPFVLNAAAYGSDSRTKTISMYYDTDASDFNGTLFVSNLADSGSYLVGANLPDSSLYFYAIAYAGNDSAAYYHPFFFNIQQSESWPNMTDPADTACTVPIPSASFESFTLILLNNGGTVDSPPARADSIGTNANYSVATPLLDPADTAQFFIWTREATGGIMLAIRTDTTTLTTGNLPRGILINDTGIRAFTRTIVSTEFLRSNGTMIGDTKTTSYIGDSYAYTIEYRLSHQTAQLFKELGFDTSVGSTSFSFFYADTYGGAWTEDLSVTVAVLAGVNGGITVRVSGITKDLPGGLGMAAISSGYTISSVNKSNACTIEKLGLPGYLLHLLRCLRDLLLESFIGRLLVQAYYFF